jgi:CheY-like chemotaxis protein
VPKKILVVDDESDVLKVVVARLKALGCEVVTALDGEKALDITRKEKLDLILLDLRLPSISGYEVCEAIKKDDALKAIPIILLTASAGAADLERTKMCEAEDYLIKPFEAEELLAKVKKFLE